MGRNRLGSGASFEVMISWMRPEGERGVERRGGGADLSAAAASSGVARFQEERRRKSSTPGPRVSSGSISCWMGGVGGTADDLKPEGPVGKAVAATDFDALARLEEAVGADVDDVSVGPVPL
jgi:hypothetical protein